MTIVTIMASSAVVVMMIGVVVEGNVIGRSLRPRGGESCVEVAGAAVGHWSCGVERLMLSSRRRQRSAMLVEGPLELFVLLCVQLRLDRQQHVLRKQQVNQVNGR